jgi:hypothetical protein
VAILHEAYLSVLNNPWPCINFNWYGDETDKCICIFKSIFYIINVVSILHVYVLIKSTRQHVHVGSLLHLQYTIFTQMQDHSNLRWQLPKNMSAKRKYIYTNLRQPPKIKCLLRTNSCHRWMGFKQNFVATLCSFPPSMTYKEKWLYKTSYNSYTVEDEQTKLGVWVGVVW